MMARRELGVYILDIMATREEIRHSLDMTESIEKFAYSLDIMALKDEGGALTRHNGYERRGMYTFERMCTTN